MVPGWADPPGAGGGDTTSSSASAAAGGASCCGAAPATGGPGLKRNTSLGGGSSCPVPAAAAAGEAPAEGGSCPGGTYAARNCCRARTRHTQGLGRASPRSTMEIGLRQQGSRWGTVRGPGQTRQGAGEAGTGQRRQECRRHAPCLVWSRAQTGHSASRPGGEKGRQGSSTAGRARQAGSPLQSHPPKDTTSPSCSTLGRGSGVGARPGCVTRSHSLSQTSAAACSSWPAHSCASPAPA